MGCGLCGVRKGICIYFFLWLETLTNSLKKLQIPLRTLQRPQPGLPPNRVCLHFSFSYHECTHFACPSFLKNEHYLITLSVHTLCLDQFCFCTFVYTSTLCKCTLASTSLPSVLSANQKRALNYMLCSDWFIKHLMNMMMDLNCCL